MKTLLKRLPTHPFRFAGFLILLAAVPYLGYCSVPHGYGGLEILEAKVDHVTALGASLDEVRAGLDTLGIEYTQRIEQESGSVFGGWKGVQTDGYEGELLLFSRHQADAWHWPCSEQVWVFVLFDSGNRVVKRHRERFHLCP